MHNAILHNNTDAGEFWKEKAKMKGKNETDRWTLSALPDPYWSFFLTLFKKHLTPLLGKKGEKDCFYWSGKASPWVRSPDKRLECKRRSGSSLCHWWRHQPLRRWTHLVFVSIQLGNISIYNRKVLFVSNVLLTHARLVFHGSRSGFMVPGQFSWFLVSFHSFSWF